MDDSAQSGPSSLFRKPAHRTQPKDFAETPTLRARVRAVADDSRHRRRNRCRDSGRNRRQHGAVSQPQAPDQLGGRVPRQQSVGGQAKNASIKRANKWLLAALVQSAWATVRQRGSIFQKRFYRQMQHRGRKRALIAAARSLLEVVWQVLQRMTPYNEPANEVLQQQERGKKIRHHLQRLRQLGIDISDLQLPPLTPLIPSDGTRLLTGTPHPLGVLGIHAR